MFIPCHRNYSQSEYWNSVVYSTVLHFKLSLACAARMSHGLYWPLFSMTWHKWLKGECVYQEYTSDSWTIPWCSTTKRCILTSVRSFSGGSLLHSLFSSQECHYI